MLRQQIIKKHVAVDHVLGVVGHSASVFLGGFLRNILFLLVLYVLYIVAARYVIWDFLPWLFGLIGLGFFVKYCIDFFDLYLDALILSHEGITFFARDGIFRYKTDFFSWTSVETVSVSYNSVWDKLFVKGDIAVKLEHDVEFPFENVARPQRRMKKILKYKEHYGALLPPSEKVSNPLNDEKISILAEALGEVVKEYLDKKSEEEEEE